MELDVLHVSEKSGKWRITVKGKQWIKTEKCSVARVICARPQRRSLSTQPYLSAIGFTSVDRRERGKRIGGKEHFLNFIL